MNYQLKYEKWIKSPKITTEEKNFLQSISEVEKEELFYKMMEFGTGGMRGLMGLGTNRMNRFTLAKVNYGLAKYLNAKYKNPSIVIAHDSRNNSAEFTKICAQVLASNNVNVYLFNNPKPTPLLSYAIRYLNCSSGIVITASHNPPEYNGYKVYNHLGSQLIDQDANNLMEYIEQVENELEIDFLNYEQLINQGKIIIADSKIENSYLEQVNELLTNVNSDLKVIFTPLHGATGELVERLLTKNQVNHKIVETQFKPDGNFPTTKNPNPEEMATFAEALKVTKDYDADLIIATDPDGDRLGIVAKNNLGEYQLLTGNQTGGIMIDYILKQKAALKQINQDSFIATTIVTSEFGNKVAQKYKVKTKLTLTGFKYIGEIINNLTNEHDYIFGYEESFGYLIKPFARDKDSLQAVALIIQIASELKTKNKTLIDKLNELYSELGDFYEKVSSITLEGKSGMQKMTKVMEYFRNNQNVMNEFNVKQIEDYQSSQITCFTSNTNLPIELPKSNVLKYQMDEGYFVIRPSGTEPKIKLYICLNGQKSHVEKLADKILKSFMEKVENV